MICDKIRDIFSNSNQYRRGRHREVIQLFNSACSKSFTIAIRDLAVLIYNYYWDGIRTTFLKLPPYVGRREGSKIRIYRNQVGFARGNGRRAQFIKSPNPQRRVVIVRASLHARNNETSYRFVETFPKHIG